MIDSSLSLGVLVAERPSRVEVFERLRLDYCCGGGQTLAQACERRRLEVEAVCRMLEALEDPRLERGGLEVNDWRRASIVELCDHIVTAHHDRLRAELPRIDELLATVVRVHGAHHPELRDLQRLFRTMRHELESHIETEERVVFPVCRAAESGRAPVNEDLLALHEQEHADTGDTAGALCRTHRTLLDALQRFELDLHQHIHEESNVLFPRVRAPR